MPDTLTLETLAAEVRSLACALESVATGAGMPWDAKTAAEVRDRLRAVWDARAASAALVSESQARGEYDPAQTPDRATAGTPAAEDADVAAVRDAIHLAVMDEYGLDGRQGEKALGALSRLATRLREAERERDQIAREAEGWKVQCSREHRARLAADTEWDALRAQIAPLIDRAREWERQPFYGTITAASIASDLARLSLDAETT